MRNTEIKEIYDKIGLRKPEKNEKRSEFEPKLSCFYKMEA